MAMLNTVKEWKDYLATLNDDDLVDIHTVPQVSIRSVKKEPAPENTTEETVAAEQGD